jgi:hypothetical protein
MPRRPSLFLLLLLLLLPFLLLLSVAAPAAAQNSSHSLGVLVGAAVSGSPLGGIAERNGTFAIPGQEYEVRLLLGSARGHEWSVGVLRDSYRLAQAADISTRSHFDYNSTGTVVGYGFTEETGSVPVVYGVDLGWQRFSAASSTPNYYTGEQEDTRTSGDAIVLGVSYGVEIPLQSVSLIPRVRIATNYPDFGGGEGYSGLHRQHDLGFKASFGISVKAATPFGRK